MFCLTKFSTLAKKMKDIRLLERCTVSVGKQLLTVEESYCLYLQQGSIDRELMYTYIQGYS